MVYGLKFTLNLIDGNVRWAHDFHPLAEEEF